MLHALGFPGGAAGVQDEQRVLGVHFLGSEIDAAFVDQLVEVHQLGAGNFGGRIAFAAQVYDVFDYVQALNRFCGDASEVDLVPAAVTDVCGDNDLGLGVQDTVPE